ncbi:MAG: anaerobic ribonucleoside-triphosphate reductase [Promethearchaeota archaeon]
MVLVSDSEITKKNKIKKLKSKYLKNLLPRVFRTEGDMVEFDPLKIEQSIIKETELNIKSVNRITELVVRRIISSGIKFLSGPHIREIVCSILSEQHFEDERKLYTRIGMPLMDYEEILERRVGDNSNQQLNPESVHHIAANRISQEYSVLRILNSEESKAHLYGDIDVHMLHYFDLRPYCHQWDPRMILTFGFPPIDKWTYCNKSGPASNLKTAVIHLAKWLGFIQNEFSGKQSYDYITTFLAPYTRGLNDREIEQGIKLLIIEINQIFAIRGERCFSTSISCRPTIPDALVDIPAIGPKGKISGKYGDYKEECLKLFNILTDIFINGDYNGTMFAFPNHEIKINKKWLKEFEPSYLKVMEELITVKSPYFFNLCPEWVSHEKTDFLNYITKGSIQSITLNLPRYAFMAKDEVDYFKILEKNIELCSRILLKKRDIINKRLKTGHLPLTSGKIKGKPIYKLKDQSLSIEFLGLNESVKSLTNFELHEDYSAYNLGKKILRLIATKCRVMSERDDANYCLWEQDNNSSSNRLANLDIKHFPKKIIPLTKGNYTKSSHFRDNKKMSVFERIKRQGEFHPIINGQAFSYVPLGNQKLEREELWELTKKICLNTNTGYFTYTID